MVKRLKSDDLGSNPSSVTQMLDFGQIIQLFCASAFFSENAANNNSTYLIRLV